MTTSFLIFMALQAADLLTTVLVLRLGGIESNPLIRHFMTVNAFEGLLLAKLLALGIGGICLVRRNHRAIKVTNLAFSGIVAWNMSVVARLL